MSEPASSNSSGQKFPPRFARTAEELVFHTDTDQSDYPIYLLPSLEVKIKRRPEAKRFAVFHVKSVAVYEYYNEDEIFRYFYAKNYDPHRIVNVKPDEYVQAYPQLPLPRLFEAAKSLKATLALRTLAIGYEVYEGDYEELVAEAPATVVIVALCPPFSSSRSEQQMFAIAYSTQKRLATKLPELGAKSYVARVKTRTSFFPCVKVKFCLPSNELVLAFEEVKAYLAGAEAPSARAIDQEIEELERTIAEKERELAELRTKLEELRRLRSVPGRIASLVGVRAEVKA